MRLGPSGGNSGKIRKDPGNALRVFPGISLGSTAGIPQTLQFKAFKASRAFPEFSPPPVRLGTPLFSEVVPERASQSRSWNSQQYWGYFLVIESPEYRSGQTASGQHFPLFDLRARNVIFPRQALGIMAGGWENGQPPSGNQSLTKKKGIFPLCNITGIVIVSHADGEESLQRQVGSISTCSIRLL